MRMGRGGQLPRRLLAGVTASAAIAGVIAGIGVQPSAASGTTTTVPVRELGGLGGEYAVVRDLSGTIAVGGATSSDGSTHGFYVDLAAIDPHLQALDGNEALAVDGQLVAGSAAGRAAYWDLGSATPTTAVLIPGITVGGQSLDVDGGIVVGQTSPQDGFAYDTNTGNLVRFSQLAAVTHGRAEFVSGGIVAGTAYTSRYRPVAVDMTAATPQLTFLDATTERSEVQDVDDRLVLGFHNTPTGSGSRPWIYDFNAASPALHELPGLGGDATVGYALDDGLVAGIGQDVSGTYFGIYYDLSSGNPQAQVIDPPGDGWFVPNDVDSGVIVGWVQDDGPTRAAAFVPATGRFIELATPSGGAAAQAIALDGSFIAGIGYSAPAQVVAWNLGADTDGDSFSPNGGDADDADATIYPGAPELCDAKDNDQDGTVDDGAPGGPWYTDGDGDSYGAGSPIGTCLAPPGSAAVAGDCNDSRNTTNPGATEADNGVDDDCDGGTDEGFDGDGDGRTPIGGGDANDADATVYPGAPELCDGKDNDQDGLRDEGFPNADGDGLADCVDLDDDGDDIPDARDPDSIAALVAALPANAISSGHRNAFLSRLDYVETLIGAGDSRRATTELRAIRQRVDGCSGTSKAKVDSNDWVTSCTQQYPIRAAIDSLIAALA